MSTNTERRNKIFKSLLANKKYRDEFVRESVRVGIAFQIRANRDARGWSQEKLAAMAGRKQPFISRIENPQFEGMTLDTLLRIVSAFDAALQVKIVSFSQLPGVSTPITEHGLIALSIDEDAQSISDHLWSYDEVVALLEKAEPSAVDIGAKRKDRKKSD